MITIRTRQWCEWWRRMRTATARSSTALKASATSPNWSALIKQGTCESGFFCNNDGSCAMCAVTNSIPHSGCTTLNPICNGGTSCVCDPSSSLSCSSDNHSTCNGYATMSPFSGGSCICGTTAGMGTNSACTGNLPSCKAANFGAITDATSATCQVKAKKCNSPRPIKYYLSFSYDYC